MTEKIKKGDCIQIKYVGRVKESGIVFDLNDEETAKKEQLYNPQIDYKGTIICIGEGDVIEGLDEALVGKEAGKKYTIDVGAEKAFGKRDVSLFKLVPLSKFKGENIRPMPGLQVTINNQPGLIKSVSGGRVMVDFNHPLSGKEVSYEVTIEKVVTDEKDIIEGY